MSLAAYSYAIAAFAYTCLAVASAGFAVENAQWTPARRAFVGAVVASAAWAVTGWIALVSGVRVLLVACVVLDLVRYAAWFFFVITVLRTRGSAPQAPRRRWLGSAALAIVAVLAVAAASGGAALNINVGRQLPLISMALPVVGLILTEQLFRSVPDDFRWHSKPLCVGLASLFLFDVYMHSHVLLYGRFDADLVVIRAAVHALPAPLFFIASKRHADWTVGLSVSRTAAFHGTTLVLVGVYLLFISAVGYYVRHAGGTWGRALELTLLCAALVLLALLVASGALRSKVRVFIGKHFFRYRYDYRTEWLRFTGILTAKNSPQELGALIVRGLADMVHSPSGSLWAADSTQSELVQITHWNEGPSTRKEPCDSALCAYLREREWVIDLDEQRAHPARYPELQVPAWLLDRRNWLAVPLVVADQLIGIVVLARPRIALTVNWEVRDLLKTAGRQAAGFLALMQATNSLLEVRKFDAFNRMSAFVVHDLKNIVAQLSLMMQNARRLKDNPEFQQDMLETVESSLEKMRRLMLQLREGETPAAVSSRVPLAPVCERIRASALARGRTVELRVSEPVVTRAHAERIERVIGHVVENALDATDPAGRVCCTVARSDRHAKIVVTDTGRGMSEEFIRTKLFRPFHSTKPQGMGIGTYESQQYVREIGGTLSVDSEVGRGTTVTLLLPLAELDCAPRMDLATAP